MNKVHYSNIAPIGPARAIPQVLGGIAGGVGGFLKARNEARAAGEKVTFKDAWDDVLIGAGKGALNPISGAMGLGMQGINTISQDQALKEQQLAGQDALAVQRDATANIGTDPLNPYAVAKKGNPQNSSINNNPVFSPSSASLMMGIYKK